MANWDKIKQCQVRLILGVGECENCEHYLTCWQATTKEGEQCPKVS